MSTPADATANGRTAPRCDGACEAFILVAAAGMLARYGHASQAMLFYPAGALFVALWYLLRQRDASFLGFVFWLWFLSPSLRRYVDFHSMRHDISPIIIAPALATLVAVPKILVRQNVARRDAVIVLGGALLAYLYGTVTGALLNDVEAALAAALTLLAPIFLGLFVLTSAAANLDDTFLRTIRRAMLVLGVYAVIQFFFLPAWDAHWMIEADIVSVGRPFPTEVRVFSTLNTAHPFAVVMAVILVVDLAMAGPRRVWTIVGLVVGHLALGLSLVRAAWFGYIAALAVLIRLGRVRLERYATVALISAVLVSTVSATTYSTISARASNTASVGSADQSLQERLEFQAMLAPHALSNLIGQGLGSAGLSTKLQGQEVPDDLRHVDSGIFETLLTLGAILGTFVLGSLVVVTVTLIKRSRGGPGFHAGYAAGIVVLVSGLLFSNTLDGAAGALLWTLLALSARSSHDQRTLGHRYAIQR